MYLFSDMTPSEVLLGKSCVVLPCRHLEISAWAHHPDKVNRLKSNNYFARVSSRHRVAACGDELSRHGAGGQRWTFLSRERED